jgi:hypothetical protein
MQDAGQKQRLWATASMLLAAASLIDNATMLTLRLIGTFQSEAMVSEKLNAASFAQRDDSGQITRRTCTGT